MTHSTTQRERGSGTASAPLHKKWNVPFETQVAANDLDPKSALDMLGYEAYFRRQGLPVTRETETVLHYLAQDNLAFIQDNGLASITNMGALLFANDLPAFPSAIARKAARVIQYDGRGRFAIARQKTFDRGYVLCLDEIVEYLFALLPARTVIERATRRDIPQLPEPAVREAVANALIHQDFGVSGAGPLIEVFDNRLEVTNPGAPLVETLRIVNDPPRSRNELMAALMRRLDYCEEAGSGWDRMVATCEMRQLPAPRIEVMGDNTRVTLFSETPFKNLTSDERQMACYWHACVRYADADSATNRSLREHFGLADSQSAQVSRLVKDCMERGLIKQLDPAASKKEMRYVPWWAQARGGAEERDVRR